MWVRTKSGSHLTLPLVAWSASRPFLLAKAMRIHQWPKNLLVFLPALASQRFGDIDLFVSSLQGFLAFCLAASAVYLVNDLWDIAHDRQHPTNCARPFASAALSPSWGYLFAPSFLVAAIIVASGLPISFLITLVFYVLLALAYSAWLKQIIMLDVIVIAMFYGIRVIAGYEATGLAYSVGFCHLVSFYS